MQDDIWHEHGQNTVLPNRFWYGRILMKTGKFAYSYSRHRDTAGSSLCIVLVEIKYPFLHRIIVLRCVIIQTLLSLKTIKAINFQLNSDIWYSFHIQTIPYTFYTRLLRFFNMLQQITPAKSISIDYYTCAIKRIYSHGFDFGSRCSFVRTSFSSFVRFIKDLKK